MAAKWRGIAEARKAFARLPEVARKKAAALTVSRNSAEEALVRRGAVVNDCPAILSAVLALIVSCLHMAGRFRDRLPTFSDPTGIFDVRGVALASDLAAQGPIKAGG
jgi:hypothetical protein